MSEFIGTKLTMNLGERSYDIIIKSGSLENLYQFARLDRRVAVVTDSGVPAQYAQRVADQCKDARIITVPQGEASKSFKILESVLRQMLDFGMGRGDSGKRSRSGSRRTSATAGMAAAGCSRQGWNGMPPLRQGSTETLQKHKSMWIRPA